MADSANEDFFIGSDSLDDERELAADLLAIERAWAEQGDEPLMSLAEVIAQLKDVD